MSNIELLAPAGNFDCLKAAVQSGADAVYFAGKKFGARSFAQNFSEDEIKRAIDYCHLRGVKTHITVNTAYSDTEIPYVLDFVDFLYKEGADALIVSDVGLISEIKKHFSNISVHASTQMTIHSLDGVKFAENLGADRVVLSRELPFSEINYISSNCNAEIEIFVHGALCMSYSGQCLLSSMIGGRSGNRGSCAQPCRLPFGQSENEKKFILSLKDLSLINYLNEIKTSKICSLKIEGRMKGEQYVAAVVSTYRKYLDNSYSVSNADSEILERVFYRGGLTDGYFKGKKSEKMFTFEKPDNPYLKQSKEILSQFDKNYEKLNLRKINVDMSFSAQIGEYPELVLKSNDTEVIYRHNSAAIEAKNKPIDEKLVSAQLLKTGGTPFDISNLKINLGKGLFFSKSELNEIRRNSLLVLEEKLIKNYKRISSFSSIVEKDSGNIVACGYTAFVTTVEQFDIVSKYNFKRIYFPLELSKYLFSIEDELKNKICLALPEIIFDSELKRVEELVYKAKENGIGALLVNNPAQLKFSKDFIIVLSHRFNIWNSHSLKLYKDKYSIKSAFLSPELSLRAIVSMNKAVETEFITYGHLPVMVTENCIIKNADSCPCNNEFVYITDRMGVKFPVRKSGSSCRNIMFNSVPLYLADKKELTDKTGCVISLYFTIETTEEVRTICENYFERKVTMHKSYTRGHYLK